MRVCLSLSVSRSCEPETWRNKPDCLMRFPLLVFFSLVTFILGHSGSSIVPHEPTEPRQFGGGDPQTDGFLVVKWKKTRASPRPYRVSFLLV